MLAWLSLLLMERHSHTPNRSASTYIMFRAPSNVLIELYGTKRIELCKYCTVVVVVAAVAASVAIQTQLLLLT